MSALVCCATDLAACCACKVVSSCCGFARRSVGTRISYAVLFVLVTIVAWILNSHWAEEKLQSSAASYLKFNCSDLNCYGDVSVYRVFLGVTLFHAFFAIILFGVKNSRDPRAVFQNGLWPFKLLVYIGAILGCFFIPSSDIVPFQWVSLVGGILFILVQVVLLVDLSHHCAEVWIGKYQDTQARIWTILLVGTTFILYSVAIVLTVLIYVYFLPGASECRLNTFYNTFNMLLCIVISLTAISGRVQEKNPKSGLLQASAVSAYSTYLVWSAISSEPQDDYPCNTLTSVDSTQTVSIILGVIFAFVSIPFSAIRTANGSSSSSSSSATYSPSSTALTSSRSAGGATLPTTTKGSSNNSDEDDELDDEKEETSYNYFYFHVSFALAAMYMAEVLTGWNTLSTTSTDSYVVGQSLASVWAKVGTSWACILIYFWSLIAPIVLKNRDFS